MKRLFSIALCAMLVAVFASSANAGILHRHLSFDGTEDILTDESRATLVKGGTNSGPGFEIGDFVYGFASISDTTKSGTVPTPDEIAILYAARISGTFTGGDFGRSGFTLTADTTFFKSLLTTAMAAEITDTRTVFLTLSSTTEDPLLPLFVGTDLTDFDETNWDFEIEGGIDVTAGDFFEFIPIFPPLGTLIGTQEGGFSVFRDDFTNGVKYKGVATNRISDGITSGPGSTSLHDVRLIDARVSDNSSEGNKWLYRDKASFGLNAVPEPGSFLIWGAAAGLGLIAVRRRRNKKSAA